MAAITLEQLNATDRSGFVAALSNIYEKAVWIAEVAARARPFGTLAALAQAMQDAVLNAAQERQEALIAGHPDLANKAVPPSALTAESRSEQTGAGLDRLSEEEFARFQQLNAAYREKFGFPFILCVRRHTKDSILREFARRLQNDRDAERAAALREVVRIAQLRLDDQVKGPDRLKVHGRLSTHVLDTYSGQAAAGVEVELAVLSAGGDRAVIACRTTNADGRTDRPLIAGQPIPIGSYELRFAIGPYFAARGLKFPEPVFLDIVPVRFSVADAEGHYHIPLLATPWSYTTYRGT